MNIYGYTRISVDLQEETQENTSIENQKRIIRDYVAENFADAELCIFEDRDRSGYTFAQRENYQKMRNDLMSGKAKILVIKDFSRFSRRNSLGLLELETLCEAGVRLISIGDGIDYPTKDDWMLIQFKFLMNEMPVTDTSKKIKHIITSRQKAGKWVCAVPYGYRMTNTKDMTYEIDPPAAENVREIFRLYNNGWGYKKIANYLTDSGIPTPRINEISQKEAEGKATKLKAKNEWSIITVSTIIQNDFYIGTLRQKKYTRKGINGKDIRIDEDDQIAIENAHDPIIDAKTFAVAQEQIKLRSKNNYRGEKKYPTDYSGFLVCGDCGAPMFSMSRPDLAPAYTCGTYHKRGKAACSSHHIRVSVLDGMLKNYLIRVRDNCGHMIEELEKEIREQPNHEAEIGRAITDIEKQLEDAKNQIKELYKQKMLAMVGKSEQAARIAGNAFDEIETELTDRIANLGKQLDRLNDRRNNMIQTNRKAKTVIEVFDDIVHKEKLDKRDIGLIVDHITVFEDHIKIKLKSDVDALLTIDNSEDFIGIPDKIKDSKDLTVVQSGAKKKDKAFHVNVVNSGDPLEIYTEKDGEVIFKKYSPIGELSSFVGAYTETIFKATGLTVVITDKDSVISTAGPHRKDLSERRLTPDCEKLFSERSTYIYKIGEKRVQVTESQEKLHVGVCAPIIVEGDIIGSIILLIDDMGTQPNDADIKLTVTSAQLLSKQIEA